MDAQSIVVADEGGTAVGSAVAPAHAERAPGVRAGGSAATPLASLFDLPLQVSIEIGRTEITVEDVLKLGRGSVIELDRLAGEPIDIYVGNRRFAEGEVVVVGENFGVRITRMLPSAFRPEGE